MTTSSPKREDYPSLSAYVAALQQAANLTYSMTNGGGIAGSSTYYEIITYIRNGEECDGYMQVSGSAYLGNKSVKYFDESGKDITAFIYEDDDVLYYQASFSGAIQNVKAGIKEYWPVILAALAVIGLVIGYIIWKRKHKK